MTINALTENIIEEIAFEHFRGLNANTLRGTDVDNAGERADSTQVLLQRRVTAALHRINPDLSQSVIEQVGRALTRPPHPTLIQNNQWLNRQMLDGVEVEYKDATSGETRGGRAKLIDFDKPENNDWLVVRQLTITGPSGKHIRPDLTVFLNGLPVAVIELKDPTDEEADFASVYRQLQRYMETAPDFFAANVVLVSSDGLLTRVGSNTSGQSRFMPWRPAEGGAPTLEALIKGLFAPARFLDYLRNCVVFQENERGEIDKKIAGYHQFRAVRKTRESVLSHLRPPAGTGDGRGGVIWHTQGSGKSLTMTMLAGALVREAEMKNPTIVMVTDRNDLDDQLLGTFAAARDLLRQDPIQADSRDHLGQLLDRASGGVIFTTIYKFTEAHGTITERANIVVMADEAHRSQYGFVDGGARWMREALPNATFVGFTGTPLELEDKFTARVFGEYADIYDIRQAVEDGATKPLFYESRIVKLTIDDAAATEGEALIAAAADADADGRNVDDAVRIPMEALVGAPERLERVAAFIVEHWEKRRAAMEGKAMVVTMSRDIAARLYEEIKKLRPDWHDDDDDIGMMKVIITGGAGDEPPVSQHVRSKQQRKRLAERFKKAGDDFRVAIVCDMWLTGFDCPSAHTMYLDKPLAGHNLMQAIARVNRVYGEKPGGLIVDLLGLADKLADALAVYARASGGDAEDAVKQIQDEAVPAMRSAFEKMQSFIHGCDYEAALAAAPCTVLPIYLRTIDHVFGQKDGWKRFRKIVKELSSAFALAVPRPETDDIVDHLAFFQRVAAMIRKRLADDASGRKVGRRDVDAAVRQVIGGAVDADDVIDLFAAAGLDEARLDILSDDFLSRVAALEQKNLALETLRKLLNDQIRVTERTNIVQSRKFREALEDALLKYTNKAITTAEMITRLIDLAKELRAAQKRGEELGMSQEETAFYDALAENRSAKDIMQVDTLRLMARQLAETVKKMPKLDWTRRESVRADLRRQVRRLLAKYGYPPDLSEDATQLVLKQAETTTEYGEDYGE